MNELMILPAGKCGYIYFRTGEVDPILAWKDFEFTCEKAGINIDNITFEKCVLRDEDLDEIGDMLFVTY